MQTLSHDSAINTTKALFAGKTLTAKTFSFFSPEHNQ
jgi:hypothetical protein